MFLGLDKLGKMIILNSRKARQKKQKKQKGGCPMGEVKVEVKEREVRLFSCYESEKWIKVYKVIIEIKNNIYRFYFSQEGGVIIPESLILLER